MKTLWKFTDTIGVDRILGDNTLKYSSPLSLNDIFEFSLLDIGSESLNRRIYEQKLKAFRDNLIREGKSTEDLLQDNEVPWAHEIMSSKILSTAKAHELRNIGVSCFSKQVTHPLMWAHYAERYRGAAIGFNSKHRYFKRLFDPTSELIRPVDVIYQDNLQDIRYPKYLYRKNTYWSYEQERRVFLDITKAIERGELYEIEKFEPDAIVALAITPFVSGDTLHSVTNFAQRVGLPVTVLTPNVHNPHKLNEVVVANIRSLHRSLRTTFPEYPMRKPQEP